MISPVPSCNLENFEQLLENPNLNLLERPNLKEIIVVRYLQLVDSLNFHFHHARYLESAEAAYERLEQELANSLVAEVEQAAQLYTDSAYRRDPWLWDLDWRLASSRSRSGRLVGQLYATRPEFAAVFAGRGFPAWFQAALPGAFLKYGRFSKLIGRKNW
jgi:hypothetical protein